MPVSFRLTQWADQTGSVCTFKPLRTIHALLPDSALEEESGGRISTSLGLGK
jgi:hypothetical protein